MQIIITPLLAEINKSLANLPSPPKAVSKTRVKAALQTYLQRNSLQLF
jgi:hypothetical protein